MLLAMEMLHALLHVYDPRGFHIFSPAPARMLPYAARRRLRDAEPGTVWWCGGHGVGVGLGVCGE